MSKQRIVNHERSDIAFKSVKVLVNKFSHHIDNGGFHVAIYEITHDVDKDEPYSNYELEISFEYFGYPSTKTVFNLSHVEQAKPILEGLGNLCISTRELKEFQS